MTDFLLELLSEEIPARMQDKACADLARLFGEALAAAGIKAQAVKTYATPRRLALIARGLPLATEAVSEERRGPRADAPEQAVAGFLKSTGLSRDQLEEREDAKGRFLYAVLEKPGRATADVLAEAVPVIVRDFPWPKSMRWGAGQARWVRPLQGIVAILCEELVELEATGVHSGYATAGHRFLHKGPITIGGAHDYADKLRLCHVILDPVERRQIIRDRATEIAAEAGLSLVPDEGLVAENAGLTEWPVPLLGGFDPSYLDVPREVIQLTMRANQKYFALSNEAGGLAPAFICVANVQPTDDGKSIVAGNQKVLAARLADAKFFWEQDRKKSLMEYTPRLADIIFHEKLGTVADKVSRVIKLALWLVDTEVVKPLENTSQAKTALFNDTRQAASFAKADLVTGMVGEFPELQGIIGGYYAHSEGLSLSVSDAIRDHYKPVGQGDEVPTAPVTVAVSLADKLDTIAGFFMKNMKPTGSKDPFALRRAALGIIAMIFKNNLRGSLPAWLEAARRNYLDQQISDERPDLEGPDTLDEELQRQYARIYMHEIRDFLADRLKVQQREAGVRHDLIDAVFALGGEDDFVRLINRVRALQTFVVTEDGANLLAGYKRAANILKKESWDDANVNPLTYSLEQAEAELLAALDTAEPQAAAAVAKGDFEGAMAALAVLRAPIDAFFTQVTVNDPEPAKRAARLAMLARVRDAVHRVADFSRIEG